MRRSLSLALALALALSIQGGSLSASAAPDPGYTHLWEAETAMGGEVGRTEKRVVSSETSLSFDGRAFSGRIAYSDVLGAEDPSGVYSQLSEVDLTLTGTFIDGGSMAAGTFSGDAVLVTYEGLGDLEEAVAEGVEARSDGLQVVYEVSGKWGARMEGERAIGELLYQRAEAVRKSSEEAMVRDVSWFDRIGPEPPGEPQTFVTSVDGMAGNGGSGDAPGDDGGNGSDGGQPSGDPLADAGDGTPSFWDHVRRGLSGRERRRALPVPGSQSGPAQSLLMARPEGARPVPRNAVAIDVDVPGPYLDAKNRAAGLLSDDGPVAFEEAASVWTEAREAAPGRAAPPREEDALVHEAEMLLSLLQGQSLPGAERLARQAGDIVAGKASSELPVLKTWSMAASAAGPGRAAPSVLARTVSEAFRRVDEAELPSTGAAYDAILAAAGSPRAPLEALEVARFERLPSFDATSTMPSADTLPGAVSASSEGSIRWIADGHAKTIRPERWEAYRRADGRMYWLGSGEAGTISVTDGSLLGWAFRQRRAALVDPTRVGATLGHVPLG